MPKSLRGPRYLRPENRPLAEFITNRLHSLDFYETCVWYSTVVPVLDLQDEALLGCNDRFFLMTGLPTISWYRFVIWLALGLVVYFSYGIRHSRLHKNEK